MISGIQTIIYSKNAQADRAFFKDVLGFPANAGADGWLTFTLPPSELACLPAQENDRHVMYWRKLLEVDRDWTAESFEKWYRLWNLRDEDVAKLMDGVHKSGMLEAEPKPGVNKRRS